MCYCAGAVHRKRVPLSSRDCLSRDRHPGGNRGAKRTAISCVPPMARAVHSSPTGLTGGDIWNHTRPTVDVGEAYGEEALSCSLTGKYSQSPPRSSHRRSPMPHFGTATKEISSKSPYDPLFVLEVPSSIGRQFQSHTRSPISVRTPLCCVHVHVPIAARIHGGGGRLLQRRTEFPSSDVCERVLLSLCCPPDASSVCNP